MSYIKNIFKIYTLPLLIIVISFLYLFINMIKSPGVIMYNDGAFYFPRTINEYFTALSFDYFLSENGNGVFLYIFQSVLGFLINNLFNLSFEYVSKILSLGIILLTLINLYFTIFKISKSRMASVSLTVIFLTLNQTIEYIQIGGFYYHFMSLNALFFCVRYFYDLFNQKDHNFQIKPILVLSLATSLITHPYYIVMFSVYYLTLITLVLRKKKLSFNIAYLLPVLSIIIFSLYWLIPFLKNSNLSTQSFYSDTGKYIYEAFKSVATANNAFLTNTYAFQSTPGIRKLAPLAILPIFTLLLIILFNYKNIKKNYFLKINLLAAIIFFSLSITPNIPIIGNIFSFLIESVSIFGFFRSITRFSAFFIILIIIVVSALIKNSNLKILTICLSFILLINTNNNQFKETINTSKIPDSYQKVNQLTAGTYNSILIYPQLPYDNFTWSKNENLKDFKQSFLFYDYYLHNPIITERASLGLKNRNYYNYILLSNSLNNSKIYEEVLRETNVGYILIDKTKIDFGNSIFNTDAINNFFKNSKNFKLLFEDKNIVLYEYKSKNPFDKIKFDSTLGHYIELAISQNKATVHLPFSKYFDFYAGKILITDCSNIKAKTYNFDLEFNENCLKVKNVKNLEEVSIVSSLDKYIILGLKVWAAYFLILLLIILILNFKTRFTINR